MATYRVEVRVMPRAGLLDPQGQAIQHALHALGFRDVGTVHMGKALTVEVDAASSEDAAQAGRAMCERLLANPVTEDFTVSVEAA